MAAIDRLNGLASETALAIKSPCLVATTGPISLSGMQAIDGVTVGSASERVLVKDQTDPRQNNIYLASSGNWTLAQDAGGNTDWTQGTQVFVAGGSLDAGAIYQQTTPYPVIIGTSPLVFSQVTTFVFTQSGLGAVPQTGATKFNRQFVSVFDYMTPTQIAAVLGNTGLDITAAIKAAVATGFNIEFPCGNYYITDTIPLATGGQILRGQCSRWNDGSIIHMQNAVNKPMFKATTNCKIDGFSFLGSATSGTTNQHAIYINNSNAVTVVNCFFDLTYTGVFLDGLSFYATIADNIFYATVKYQLYTNSVTSAGVDLFLRGNRFVGAFAGDACLFFTGLGSLLMSDNQISVVSPSVASIVFDTPAPLFGGVQAVNNVFENNNVSTTTASVYIKGTALLPWNNMYFLNDLFTGGNGYGLQVDYATAVTVLGGAVSSVNSGGSVYLNSNGTALDFRMDNVKFDGLAGVAPIRGAASATVNISLISPVWGGSSALLDLSALTAANIGRCDVIGGQPGTTSNNVQLPSSGSVPFLLGYGGNFAASGQVNSGGLFVGAGTGADPTVAGSQSVLLAYFKTGSGYQIRSASYTAGSLTGWAALTINGGPVSINPGTGTNVYLGGDTAGAGVVTYTAGGGLQMGAPTGGDKGSGTINMAAGLYSLGNQVVGARVTGYVAMTGTPDKGSSFATSSVTLAQLAGRVMQLQADLTTHGLVGP